MQLISTKRSDGPAANPAATESERISPSDGGYAELDLEPAVYVRLYKRSP